MYLPVLVFSGEYATHKITMEDLLIYIYWIIMPKYIKYNGLSIVLFCNYCNYYIHYISV